MNLGDGSLLSCSGKRLLSSPSGKVTVTVKYPFLPRRRSVFSCQSLLGVNYPFWSEQTRSFLRPNARFCANSQILDRKNRTF